MQVLCRADGDLTPFDDANAAVAALISTDLDPTADRLSIVPPTSRTALVAQFRPAKKEKIMPARTDRGTGRPDQKMSRSDKEWKRARFGTGTRAHQQVQSQSNAKRRQRDRTASSQ